MTDAATASIVGMVTKVPARAAATGWLNAFLAASQDAERPLLYRTLSLEFFLHAGLHIVGCDGTALFRAWVPLLSDDEPPKWPADDAAPLLSVVVMDPDGFGVGFMRTLLRVTNEEAHAAEELAVEIVEADDEAAPSLGQEFQTKRVILRACGQRLDLRCMDDQYPDWRRLNLGLQASERMDGMRLQPRLLGLIGKLKDVWGVTLDFHGDEKYVGFTAEGAPVRGVIMPMRRPEKEKPQPKPAPAPDPTVPEWEFPE